MTGAFKRLGRVLKLERKQGYQNKAVVGGMRQLAAFWVTQAREESVDEADRAFVEQVAEVLTAYDRLPGASKRAEVVLDLLEKLEERQLRVGDRRPESRRQAPSFTDRPDSQPSRDQKRAATGGETPSAGAPAVDTRPNLPPARPEPERLHQPTSILRGVGPRLAEKLARLGAENIGELLELYPRRYDDYTLMKPINRLEYGEAVTVIGTVWEARSRRTRSGEMVQATVNDGTGTIRVTWFNQPWVVNQLKAGMQVVLSGTVDQYMGHPVFNNPSWEPVAVEPLKTRRIVPIYPLTEGLRAYKMRQIMQQAVSDYAKDVVDSLPDALREKHRFYSLPQAVAEVHFPDSQATLHQARRRLVFDELFLLQLGMLGLRQDWQSQPGRPLTTADGPLDRFWEALPFALTAAQRRAIDEIRADMARAVPMNRLLQGDVGAGKTVVAASAMVIAASAGAQSAMMAPTEILAEQHFQGLNAALSPLGLDVRLLTGSTARTEREALLAALVAGDLDVLIGTHALIQEPVVFHNLGLVIIDEQHRFGVDQRQALRDKGAPVAADTASSPHLMVMTATPIPRTLALSLYGDLDISVLDELPPGRQEIKTRWLRPNERERAYAFVRGQIEAGRQAFVICPLVEESDKIEAVAAVEEHARLQDEVFPDLRLGLLHGRLRSDEKEAVMRDFYEGRLDILVSTSVIEVGIDVPNSTVMLIEGANRFGLAQLHQFRGRVGRGEHQSYCLLISDSSSGEAEMRLQAMEQTNDGFVLAERDLELRGPGQFFGRQQSGLPEIQLAALLDIEALELARREAEALYEEDPQLAEPEHAALRRRVKAFWDNAGDIS
jgi:ATP-dependent DNA helicase RecG